jgi:HAD superfamily hydrolase (TIGR01450 family)
LRAIEKKSFIDWWRSNRKDYDAILFDIDGTLAAGKNKMPGAVELLSLLDTSKFPYLLLTNDGNHSVQEKSVILAKGGLSVKPETIVSCSMALKLFAEKNNCFGEKFFVMGELGSPCFAENAGLKTERDPDKIHSCKGVIVGEGNYDWQKNFFAVFNYFIKRPKAWLVVPNPDSYWPDGSNGEIGIGAGGKARFLCSLLKEYGIRVVPVYLGKPYRLIFEFAMRSLCELFPHAKKIKKRKIIMIGDSLRSDIKGGNLFGLTTVLVMTGITKYSHLQNLKKNMSPSMVFKNIGD